MSNTSHWEVGHCIAIKTDYKLYLTTDSSERKYLELNELMEKNELLQFFTKTPKYFTVLTAKSSGLFSTAILTFAFWNSCI